jgi:hypothetical protein
MQAWIAEKFQQIVVLLLMLGIFLLWVISTEITRARRSLEQLEFIVRQKAGHF